MGARITASVLCQCRSGEKKEGGEEDRSGKRDVEEEEDKLGPIPYPATKRVIPDCAVTNEQPYSSCSPSIDEAKIALPM
jgi:hypothetical protein